MPPQSTTPGRELLAVAYATRPIPGFPGYLARADGRLIGKFGRLLSDTDARDGRYCMVHPRIDGKYHPRGTHVLICLAFHGPKPAPGYEVDHIDKDKGNNAAANLRWVTHRENSQHSQKGPAYSLEEVRYRLRRGDPVTAVARAVGISRYAVSSIKTGKSWSSWS